MNTVQDGGPHRHVVLVEMQGYLQENPDTLLQLARVYCDIWPEPPWNEYMKCCPCGLYFSKVQYHVQGITVCPHCGKVLTRAWVPAEVVEFIPEDMEIPGFIGYLLVDPSCGVIGFTWGFLLDVDTLERKLSHDFNGFGEVWYYAELGVKNSPMYRGKGLGKLLVGNIVDEVRRRYPDHPTVLRTHKDAAAFILFHRAGYNQIRHTDPNPGRVLMVCPTCRQLNANLHVVR